LRITGEFSKSDIHTWIANCLPDFPHNLEDDDGEVNSSEYLFLNLFRQFWFIGQAL